MTTIKVNKTIFPKEPIYNKGKWFEYISEQVKKNKYNESNKN